MRFSAIMKRNLLPFNGLIWSGRSQEKLENARVRPVLPCKEYQKASSRLLTLL
jgi:hypothetical protein